jgi:hypothetical protein
MHKDKTQERKRQSLQSLFATSQTRLKI